MYNAYFGFSECPFSLSPNPAFYFRSAQHEEALANLTYGVQSRKGFILLLRWKREPARRLCSNACWTFSAPNRPHSRFCSTRASAWIKSSK